MDKTILAIAKADLKTAKGLVNSNDKYQKHQAAYMTQQAIEKTLKYCIGQKTGTEPWGHDIAKLILAADVEDVEVPDVIRQNAPMYSSWESVSRYYPRTVIRRDTIAKAIRVTDEWQRKISRARL